MWWGGVHVLQKGGGMEKSWLLCAVVLFVGQVSLRCSPSVRDTSLSSPVAAVEFLATVFVEEYYMRRAEENPC